MPDLPSNVNELRFHGAHRCACVLHPCVPQRAPQRVDVGAGAFEAVWLRVHPVYVQPGPFQSQTCFHGDLLPLTNVLQNAELQPAAYRKRPPCTWQGGGVNQCSRELIGLC